MTRVSFFSHRTTHLQCLKLLLNQVNRAEDEDYIKNRLEKDSKTNSCTVLYYILCESWNISSKINLPCGIYEEEFIQH